MEENIAKPRRLINLIAVPYEDSMKTGFLWKGTYYPLTLPVPRAMDRKPAVMTIDGPKEAHEGSYLVKNYKGDVMGVVSETLLTRYYSPRPKTTQHPRTNGND